MPLLAELAAAAQIGQRENAAMLREDHRVRTESRSFVDQKTAVAVEQRRPIAVELEAFFENQKHGDAGLILRRVPDLLHLKLRRIDGRLHASPDVLLSGRQRRSDRWSRVAQKT